MNQYEVKKNFFFSIILITHLLYPDKQLKCESISSTINDEFFDLKDIFFYRGVPLKTSLKLHLLNIFKVAQVLFLLILFLSKSAI